jgi:SAM-dependent methyltransferase
VLNVTPVSLLVIAKEPLPGRAKTRLTPPWTSVINPLRMYVDGLRARTAPAASDGSVQPVRMEDGTTFPVDLERFLAPADATDERRLDGLRGPVLDVGCGSGRHLHALAVRGVFALGVDLSPVAVALAVGRGGRAIVGDIFDELPGGGWQTGLLLDGNIGIGGAPARLLARIGDLLVPRGTLLVELGAPGAGAGATRARLESSGSASAGFPWARVAVCAIEPIARAGDFGVAEVWGRDERWFARLHPVGRQAAQPRAVASSVP